MTMIDIEIRNAVPREIKEIMSFADSTARKIKNLAWAADALMIDHFSLGKNNEQLFDAILAICNSVGDLAERMNAQLERGI